MGECFITRNGGGEKRKENFPLKQNFFSTNELIYDNKHKPSLMVKIPKMTYAQLGIGTSNETFPAWIVNGKEIDYFYVGKYQACIEDDRAYSLPWKVPHHTITQDELHFYCSNKGKGWHAITKLEWMALAWFSKINNTQPKGNNYYGKDHGESNYIALPAYQENEITNTVLTGTGPITWSHNNAQDGVWDMNGNIWEWTIGVRFIKSELQVISKDGVTFGNDAADGLIDFSLNSPYWKAIDGTTGNLITPDGLGTTTNSLKLSIPSDNTAVWVLTSPYIRNNSDAAVVYFVNINTNTQICDKAKQKLKALGMLSLNNESISTYNNDCSRLVNQLDEHFVMSGGAWFNEEKDGIFCFHNTATSTHASGTSGFRIAYIDPEEEV